MATTTASLTIESSDLVGDALSLSTTNTLHKAGTTVGLDQTTGLTRTYVTATTQFDPFPVVKGTTNASKNGRVYIANLSEDETEYITISIGDATIGRLYAGDWMFMPWDSDVVAVGAGGSAIEIQAYVAEATIEYCLFNNGETKLTSDDS